VTRFIVKALELLGRFHVRGFRLLLCRDVVIADAEIPLVDDGPERLVHHLGGLRGNLPLYRQRFIL
jgi:hypothetical protein